MRSDLNEIACTEPLNVAQARTVNYGRRIMAAAEVRTEGDLEPILGIIEELGREALSPISNPIPQSASDSSPVATTTPSVTFATLSGSYMEERKEDVQASTSQDGSHLRKTVVKASECYGVEFFTLIHDSFGTIPAKAGQMFKAVRESMVETYTENDVLDDFREQFMEQLHVTQLEKMPPLPTKGTLDITKILESEFAFA